MQSLLSLFCACNRQLTQLLLYSLLLALMSSAYVTAYISSSLSCLCVPGRYVLVTGETRVAGSDMLCVL